MNLNPQLVAVSQAIAQRERIADSTNVPQSATVYLGHARTEFGHASVSSSHKHMQHHIGIVMRDLHFFDQIVEGSIKCL